MGGLWECGIGWVQVDVSDESDGDGGGTREAAEAVCVFDEY